MRPACSTENGVAPAASCELPVDTGHGAGSAQLDLGGWHIKNDYACFSASGVNGSQQGVLS